MTLVLVVIQKYVFFTFFYTVSKQSEQYLLLAVFRWYQSEVNPFYEAQTNIDKWFIFLDSSFFFTKFLFT
jgi:hypothetical protein